MVHLGQRVGAEAKQKNVQVVLGPNINLHRDPRGGRNFETFSEDPLLTGYLATGIIQGIQKTGVAACPKHLVGNESETLRHEYDVREDLHSRVLAELYLKPFEHIVRDADPACIMAAYNKIDGTFCSQSPLINRTLRNVWKYNGCVMSDWYGTQSGPEALTAGLDLEMPGPSIFRGERLVKDCESGRISMPEIDRAVLNVLRLISRTTDGYREAEESAVFKETSDMARKVAREGIVLLKNEHNTLPLRMQDATKIAVIGNAAIRPSVTGGGSAACHPQYIHRPLDCIRELHSSPDLVEFAPGVNPNYCFPIASTDVLLAPSSEKPGIDIEYFNSGDPTPVFSETTDPVAQVIMIGHLKPGIIEEKFHFVITTQLTPKSSGLHSLGAQLTGAHELYVDGNCVLSGDAPVLTVEQFLFMPKTCERVVKVQMDANKTYQIRLVVHARPKDPFEPLLNAAKICFEEQFCDDAAIEEASALATRCGTSIIFGGRTLEYESEGFDLPHLHLPESQIRMIKSVAAASQRTVLVLHGGNPIDVSAFVDDVDATLFAHFPGQEGAPAIAEILAGDVNPSGRLATSWPLSIEQTPSYNNFPATMTEKGPVIDYTEGLQMGYRHPDAQTASRYPFGFGLSYTTYTYSDLKVIEEPAASMPYAQQMIEVAVKVSNQGSFPGREVIQVYSRAPVDERHWRPERELKGFSHVTLKPGESTWARIKISKRELSGVWDEEARRWVSAQGTYHVEVGGCSAALVLDEQEWWDF